MGAKKISQLAAAATPLTGAEQTPLVQTGASVRATTGDVVTLARRTLQGSEASIRAAPSSGASSGTVDLSSATGLAVVLTGGAPTYNAAVACVATSNVTLSGEQTIDGVTTSASRVLLTGQTAAKDNGIWVTASGAWTRATDADVGQGYCDDEVSNGQNVKVTGGTTNSGTTWTLTTANPITLGTTALTYTKDGTAKAHNLTFTNPSQTFTITGFTGMVAGMLPYTVRFGGAFKLTHSASLFLNNSGQDYLTKADDMALVFPTGATTCRVFIVSFTNVLTVTDARTSDGEGERVITFGNNPTSSNPGLQLAQNYSRRKTLMESILLRDDGDTCELGLMSVQSNGSVWTGAAPLGLVYAWQPTLTLNKGTSLNNASYASGRHSQLYYVQVETPTTTTRGGGIVFGCAMKSTTAGQSVPWDAAYIMPGTAGRGLVLPGRAAAEESGQTVGTFNYSTAGAGSTPDYGRIFNFSSAWNWGQDVVKGNLTLAMSDEGTGFSGIAMRTMASVGEGVDLSWNTSASELRIGTVTGGAYTARWGIQKSGGHLLPVTTNAVDIGSSSRRLRKLWGVDADLSGSVTLGDAAADVIVMNAKSVTKPNAPAFSAIVGSNVLDVTGDATAYTLICTGELYDRGSDYDNTTGVFTAPVTGLYQFNISVQLGGVLSAHTDFYCSLVTSGRTFALNNGDLAPGAVGTGQVGMCRSLLATMTAGDTAYVQIQVNGSTKVVDVIAGTNATNFSGFLVA